MPIDPFSTNQVEVIRGPAALRYGSTSIGGVVSATNNRIPEAVPTCAAAPFQSYGLAGQGAARKCGSPGCLTAETRMRSTPSIAASKAPCCSMPAAAISPSMPTPMAARPATTTSRTVPICSTRPGRSTAASRIPRRRPTEHRSAARISSTAASSARRSRRTSSITFPASTAPSTRPASMRTRPNSPPRANTGPMRGDRSGPFLGRRHRLQHNEIGLADPVDLSTLGVRQTFTNKEQEGRVEVQLSPFNVALCRHHHGGRRCRPGTGTDGTARMIPEALSTAYRSEQEHPRRRLRLQRIEIQRSHQGANRRAHRTCRSAAAQRGFIPENSTSAPIPPRSVRPRATSASRRRAAASD